MNLHFTNYILCALVFPLSKTFEKIQKLDLKNENIY